MKAFCRDCFWRGDQAVRRCSTCASPRIVAHPELASLAIAVLAIGLLIFALISRGQAVSERVSARAVVLFAAAKLVLLGDQALDSCRDALVAHQVNPSPG